MTKGTYKSIILSQHFTLWLLLIYPIYFLMFFNVYFCLDRVLDYKSWANILIASTTKNIHIG